MGNRVRELLKKDSWSLAELRVERGVARIRNRNPVLTGREAEGYGHVLKSVWGYASEGSGALPSPEQSAPMESFENRFCRAVEQDAHAVLTAVLTFDGARQWVFYTGDVEGCGARLQDMPQEEDPYPIELTTHDDPDWSYLRDEILKRVPWQGA